MTPGAAPLVTVLMPVYNGQRFLREAIESVLGQSFSGFEFLIIDDGSTDSSPEILASYHDPRIRREKNPVNRKLPYTRNLGLKLARGKYLANMDCDDVALPGRLQAQLDFLSAHPGIGACGGWVEKLSYRGGRLRERETVKYPEDPGTIKARLLFDQPLANPSAMMNLSLARAAGLKYRPEHLAGLEDWGFWQEASSFFQIANLPQVLLHYRFFEDNLTSRSGGLRNQIIRQINRKNLEKLGMEYSPCEELMHYANAVTEDPELLKDYHRWLLSLGPANRLKKAYPEKEFEQTLARQWWLACQQNTRLGLSAWRIFFGGRLSQSAKPEAVRLVKFAAKCLLKHGREPLVP